MTIRKFADKFLKSYRGRKFQIEFWDGEKHIYGTEDSPRFFSLKVKSPSALRNIMFRGSLGFAEAYMDQQLEIDGDIADCIALPYEPYFKEPEIKVREKFKYLMMYLKNRNTLSGSKKNIHSHYDLGNDFYKLWLDKNLQYTCAYFAHPEQSLEDAQINKMEYICRKLELKEGETLLETGSGWGGFAIYAAKNYGVKIKSYNISHEQVKYAKEWAKRENLEDRVEFIEDDYRNVSGVYDKYVSIGMLEHVGLDNYATFTKTIDEHLKDKGLGLIHSITKRKPAPTDPFTAKYIFPGGLIPALSEIIPHMEERLFTIIDIDNLKLHYARTLHFWRERFEKNLDKIREMFDERFIRMWRIYLSGAMVSFSDGGMTLSQILFYKGKLTNLRLNRRAFYDTKYEDPHWTFWT